MSSIVFFSVIYPAMEGYLEDFLSSLGRQSNKDFDVFIVNDRFSNFDRYKSRYRLKIIEQCFDGSPAKVREAGINYLLQNGKYDAIVFGDSDDYFADNRIEKVYELLKDTDIVVNDLNIIDDSNNIMAINYISKRLQNGEMISSDFILDKNIFGLTNTAIRMDVIKPIEFHDDLIAIDWFLFSQLLEQGYKAIFSNETTSYYRQHENNLVGMQKISGKNVLKGIRVKVAHYKAMSRNSSKYAMLYERFQKFEELILSDELLLDTYLRKIADMNINTPLWWEEIKLMEL